ncbi:hypothetical protein Tco_0204025 [Tanacetum coccineum]
MFSHYHSKLLAEAQKEKEDLKAKVEKWHNSSKNLSKLLNTQMSANDKFGLGYGDHRYDGILSYENEVLQSVFMNKESDIENQPVYDRFAEGMHAVPPPMTGNYMPSGPEIEVDYSQFIYGPKQTQPSESKPQSSEIDTCESNISAEPSELVFVKNQIIHISSKDKELLKMDVSRHMTGNKAYLAEFQDFNGGPVAFGGSKGYITGKGQQEANQNAGTEEIINAGDSNKEDESDQISSKASSTNLVNTVSIPVNTASPFEGLSLADPTNPEEDDLEIPPLEDIYQNSTDGIFTTSSYDDVGAMTDFTNLESIVNVSPIPTSRIHPSHPKALILGDPTSAVQTRSKINTSSGAHAFVSYNPQEDFRSSEDESWVDAMQEELLQFKIQKVWVLVDLPYGSEAIVCACSRFQVTPKSSHLSAVKRIFRYLKGKPKLGLWYPKVSSFDLESYSDSDYAGANLDRKSTTGGCQFLGRRLISWQCKKQTIVATSTTEAEYVAAASCCGQVLWIQNQIIQYIIPKQSTLLLGRGHHCHKRMALEKKLTQMSEANEDVSREIIGTFLSEVPLSCSHSQPTPSPAPTSEVPLEQQTNPSPRPSPTTTIPDSIPETSGGNLGGHSSSDKSLSGNEGEMTIQSVYDLCLSLCEQVSDQAKEIQDLKAQITKLKKQAKPVIKQHKAWLKSVSLKQRFPRKSFSKKHRVHKESVSKQGRKFAKGESSVQRDPLFNELPEDTVDHMETENAQDEGRTRDIVDEDKEIEENVLSTEDALSTDKDKVSTDMEKVSTDRPIVSTDGSKVSTEGQNEGTEGQNEGTEEQNEGTKEQNEGTEEQNEGTEEQVESTDGHKKGTEEEIATQATQTSTQTPTSTIFGDDETIAKVLLNMSQAKAVSREKEKGVELKDVEETDRPKPTSTRSLLTLKPLPKIDPKDKGKKKIEEEDESDGIPEAEKKIAEEKAANEALIRNFDDIKARMEADRFFAEKLQEHEREQFTIEERAKFLHDTIAAQRKFLAQQRSEAISIKPPTKNQLRNQMMTYLKHVGNFKHAELKIKKFEEVQALYKKIKRPDEDFISIGSAEDERLIKRMNEKEVDFSKDEMVKEKSKAEVKEESTEFQKESKEEESTKKRKLGTRKKRKSRKRRYIQNTSEDDSDKENDELRLHLNYSPDEGKKEDLNAVYQMVTEKYQDEMPEGFDRGSQQDWKIKSWKLHSSSGVHTLVTDTCLVIHMLVEKKYPLKKEVLEQMLKLKLESKEENTMALELIKFVKKILAELGSEEHKNWLVHKQTACGKDFSNPFMVDNLPKIVGLSTHLASVVKSWLVHDQTVHALTSPKANELTIPEQTATGKGTSNPLMAGSLPKTTKPT